MATRRARVRRIAIFATCLMAGIIAAWSLVAIAFSPLSEARLLAGKHPDIVIDRKVMKDSHRVTIRDDLPSTCDCPLHRMLRGDEVVRSGWNRFVAESESGMQKGDGMKSNKYFGIDAFPQYAILIRRVDDRSLELELMDRWSASTALTRLQEKAGNALRVLFQ